LRLRFRSIRVELDPTGAPKRYFRPAWPRRYRLAGSAAAEKAETWPKSAGYCWPHARTD